MTERSIFKDKNENINSGNKTSSYWLWLLFGITLGMLIYPFIFDAKDSNDNKVAASDKNHALDLKSIKNNPSKNADGNSYDFYRLLSKNNSENKQKTTKETKKVANKALDLKSNDLPQNKYIIQAGSFLKLDDAEQLKAKLALSGFTAEVRPVRVKKNTWYRIQMGPFETKDIAKQEQAKLKERKITGSLILKTS